MRQYRTVDPWLAGSWTFHIFYVKRIWALLWDALLRELWVNTWNYKSAWMVLSSRDPYPEKCASNVTLDENKNIVRRHPTCGATSEVHVLQINNKRGTRMLRFCWIYLCIYLISKLYCKVFLPLNKSTIIKVKIVTTK